MVQDSNALQIAVILAAHNRKEKTLACLTSLRLAMTGTDTTWHVYLCDDGSSDGTTAAVGHLLGDAVTIVPGDGALFWNQGMRAAWTTALPHGPARYLLLNDDVVLAADSIKRLLSLLVEQHVAILIGATRDPVTDRCSYGGFRRGPWWNRLKMVPVGPVDQPTLVDSFNCNVVLIPHAVVARIGILDPGFVHAFGDIDYGLRARQQQVAMLLLPGYAGECAANPPPSPPSSSLWRRLAEEMSIKGMHSGPWLLLCRRHAGALWPLVYLSPYLKMLFRSRSAAWR